jgi:hypothetical protein
MLEKSFWKMYLYIMKPKKIPAKVASIMAPCFTFLFDILNARYPKPHPNTIPTRVRRMLIALAGLIELIIKLEIMKVFTKTSDALMPPEMYLNTLAPKKFEAIPRNIKIKASKTGILLKKLRRPCKLKTGHPAAWEVLIVNLQVVSSAVTVKSSLVGVPSLLESQYISKYVPQVEVPH